MIDPVAFSFLGLEIKWYGISYVFGFLFAYFFILHYCKYFNIKKEVVEDIFLYVVVSGVLGGRIFYVLFYNPLFYFENPSEIVAVWNGGMSIHGGIIGAFFALFYSSKKYDINLLKLTDLFSLPAGFGLAFGRFANFINQELVGTITNYSWGVVFSNYDNSNRFPYQIFASFKNMIMFEILYFLFIFRKLKNGIITSLFLIIYNLGRFFLDFMREPTISLGVISMGQLLCLLFSVFGFFLLYKIIKKTE